MIKQNCFCTKKMNYIMRTLNQFRVSNVTVNGINLMLHYVNVKSFCAFHFEKIRSRGRPLNSSRILNTVSGLKYLKKIHLSYCRYFSLGLVQMFRTTVGAITFYVRNRSVILDVVFLKFNRTSRISQLCRKRFRCFIRSRSN